jgi:Fe-S-cluster-containing hydrogenase components 1
MRFHPEKKRYAMAVDTRRCVGCSACVIACKEENALPLANFRSWVETETSGTYPNLAMEIRSERCEQCSDAPCVSNCPTGASHYARRCGPGRSQPLHGMQSVRRRLSLRGALHPPRWVRRQMHLLPAPSGKSSGAGVRHRLPHAVADVRRRQRFRQQDPNCCAPARGSRSAPRRERNPTCIS